MKHLLAPVALVATSVAALAQSPVNANLLFPSHQIAPTEVTGTICDLQGFVSADLYADLTPLQQQMVVRLAHQVGRGDAPHACWMGNAPPAVMALWNAVMRGAPQFNPVTRWASTATSGGGLGNGDPTIITYSFVPDGTNVPGEVGAPAGPSELFSSFNGGFPSQQIWQDRVADAFERWGQLCGITYVFEPNDDGVSLASAAGQVGVRGDVRIAAKPIDGGGGILAYNYFPNNGDMVLDSNDIAFYSNASSNYLRLFNVIAHEHGHGMGIAHVCPVNSTKLMEPFLSTAFNGPQFDDILTSNRLYGDSSEPNDSSGAATDLGTLGNGVDTTTLVSIDGNGDQDWFEFTVTGPKTLDVEVRPAGSPYLEGDQLANGSCEPGVNFDPRQLRNLDFEIIDTNGSSVLGSANSSPAGGTENASAGLPSAGTYYVRVFGGGIDQVQMYELELTIADGAPFGIVVVGGVPSTVPSDSPFALDIEVVPASGSADPNTGTLYTSINQAPFASTSLVSVGGNNYRGLLPSAACFDTIDWYVTFAPVGGGPLVAAPFDAPAGSFATQALSLSNLFDDDFESNQGWTVVNDAALTDGAWDRGAPVGGGDRGDPATDSDGSGQCYLTDNVDGNSDVDGGTTSLLSPLFDLSSYPAASISYSYWYTNNFGGNPGTDTWLIEISDNAGATWSAVLSTTASTSDWVDQTIDVGSFVSLTSQVRMRFTASDTGSGAVVEAGVDAFRVDICADPPTQVLPGACAGAFSLSTIGTDTDPLAGSTVTLECSAVSQVAGPVFQGFVIGLSQVNLPLASCGCVLHPSLDVIDIQLGSWASPALESWSLPLVLPPAASGAVIYAQGFIAELTASTCTEAGLALNTTDGLRITVQ